MLASAPNWLSPIVVALIGGLFLWLSNRKPKAQVAGDIEKAQSEMQNALVDQLQEERDKIAARWETAEMQMQAEVRRLREAVKEATAETRAARDEARRATEEAYAIQDRARIETSIAGAHIYQLRAHIEQGLGPPAPDLPRELHRIYFPQAADG